ncbi:unnamed protein product [Prorocentrum cordatum]|uniref:Cilia- and flagella-associated protein 52 n=1 Tax=Prorocentrum cordatum TaxID=2364126 RepID=A0ABN9RBJ3_9DINO|nr:unnamed protein product [Polarella glacialis]
MGFPADVIIWSFADRMEIHRLSLHKVSVQSLCFSPTENYLATLGGQDDNSLVIWDVSKGSAVCGTPAASDTAQCVKFFSETDFKLVTGGNYHVISWDFDLENKKLRSSPANLGQLKRVVTNVVADPEDKYVYCGTSTGARGERILAGAHLSPLSFVLRCLLHLLLFSLPSLSSLLSRPSLLLPPLPPHPLPSRCKPPPPAILPPPSSLLLPPVEHGPRAKVFCS